MAELDVKLPVGRMVFGYVIIVLLLVGVTAATHFVPAGEYQRAEQVSAETGATMEVVVADSFRYIEAHPQGIVEMLYSPIRSLYYMGPVGAVVVVFILLVGGAFTAMRRTGALDAGVLHFVRKLEGREHLLIPLGMTFFSLFGSLFGILEEVTPFVIIIVPMTIAIGYDSIVGLMIVFGGCAVGFSAAMTNPFTVGVAQQIAELPMFSGLGYRFLVWVVMLGVAIAYTSWYARRVRRDPSASYVKGFDSDFREQMTKFEAEHGEFSDSHRKVLKVIGILVLILMILVVVGPRVAPAVFSDISFILVMLIFLVMGVLAGLFGGLGVEGTARAFAKGFVTFIPAAFFIMLARAVIVIASEGRIIDPLLYELSSIIGQFHAVVASWAMLGVQAILNFFVSSGSGQAMISTPVMVPLGEMVGVSRQTSVLAFQMGDGFSNLIWPTNPLLIVAISLAGISWTRWARFMVPLQILFLGLGCVVLAVAVMIGWGPF